MASPKINLNPYSLVPMTAWKKVDHLVANMHALYSGKMLDKDYVSPWPEIYAESTGRSAVKSIGNSGLNLIALISYLEAWSQGIIDYGCDILCVYPEESMVESTIAADINKAIGFGGWPENIFNMHTPGTAKKFCDITWRGKRCRIHFKHMKDGYLGVKGLRPLKGNKWWALWLYEFDNFTWDNKEVEQYLATIKRDAECNLHTLIEQNEPRAGSVGMWTKEYYEMMTKQQNIREKLREAFPDNENYKRDILYFKKYSMFDFTKDEYEKFTNKEQRSTFVTLALADRDTFEWVYRGKPIACQGAIYKNLKYDLHFGMFPEFEVDNPTYDRIYVGVDFGNIDACCACACGVQFPKPATFRAPEKKFRIQDGLAVAWHSNRWNECLLPDPTNLTQSLPGFHTHKDVSQWVSSDLVNYLTLLVNKYPNTMIEVQLEYADIDTPSYISFLNKHFYMHPNIQFTPNWYKGVITDRIVTHQLIYNRPGVYKCANPYLWQAKTSLRYKENYKEKEDKEAEVLDNTTLLEQKYFDISDANDYEFSQEVQSTIKQALFSTLTYKK